MFLLVFVLRRPVYGTLLQRGGKQGYQDFNSLFHEEPLLLSLKMDLNFPILLSIVPAARDLGQEHRL